MLQDGEEIPLAVSSIGTVPLVTHELPSAGLVYAELGVSLADLSLEDIFYLPLLCRMMLEAGTSELSPEVLMPLVSQGTGGVSSSVSFRSAPAVPFRAAEPYAARGILFLSGKVRLFGVTPRLSLVESLLSLTCLTSSCLTLSPSHLLALHHESPVFRLKARYCAS